MSKYLETKKGSLEDMVAGVTEGKQSEDYKQLFKKELEKAGKGIGAMSDQEKKDFFNNIDKKHKAKNEDSKRVQKMNVKKASGEKLKESNEEKESIKENLLIHTKDDRVTDQLVYHLRDLQGRGRSNISDIDTDNVYMHRQNKYVKGRINVEIDGSRSDSQKLIKDLQRKYGSKIKVSLDMGEVKKEELEEGGVKDFLMDVEDDAGSMSLNDLIKKYYGQMGLSAQEIKKIYYRVNEEKEVKDNPTLQESIMDVWSKGAEQQEKIESEAKWLKTEEKEKKSLNEEKIKCPNCGHMNEPGTKKCTNCGYDLTKVEEKDPKKKAMTGSPATKVDVKPEVEYDK